MSRSSFELDDVDSLKNNNVFMRRLDWEVEFLDKKQLIVMNIYHEKMIRTTIAEKFGIDLKFIKNLGLVMNVLLFNSIANEFSLVLNERMLLSELPASARVMVVINDVD